VLGPWGECSLGEFPDSSSHLTASQVLVLRLRDSIIKMGEELEKAAESEAREKESTKYYQRRMEEMKADMDELVQRELESSRRRVELVGECPRFRGFCCSQLYGAAHGTEPLLLHLVFISLQLGWQTLYFSTCCAAGSAPSTRQCPWGTNPLGTDQTSSSVPTACPALAMPPLCSKSVPVNVSKQLTCSVCSKP